MCFCTLKILVQIIVASSNPLGQAGSEPQQPNLFDQQLKSIKKFGTLCWENQGKQGQELASGIWQWPLELMYNRISIVFRSERTTIILWHSMVQS